MYNIPMHPYLIQLGGFKLPAYGFMMAMAYLAAIWYILRKSKKENFDREVVSDLIFYCVLSGLLGGKILYILTFWDHFGAGFSEKLGNIFTLETLRVGFVFYGGFLSALAAALVFSRMKKISFFKMADLFSPALALAHALGRLGCFAAGCCHGTPTNGPFGVVFSSPFCQVKSEYLNLPIHPAQLYESFGNFFIFLVLSSLYSRKYLKKDGLLFALYLFLYSVLRFIVEFFRGDERGAFLLGLSQAQIISLVNALLFLFVLAAANRERKKQ
ncbi:MAG: prolipoprotein diacylglyceryl transferase [Elusimicrobia bacterium CG08_land_8_20_14_0_20_51_18]|nr:MAG: prolipoprotein diacylglyceryl transferase [Elusimicrobia bacterium CG08_land_8_20_14_0_20_51_18]